MDDVNWLRRGVLRGRLDIDRRERFGRGTSTHAGARRLLVDERAPS